MEKLVEYSLVGVDEAHKKGNVINVVMNDDGTHVSINGVPYLEERVTQAQDQKTGAFTKYHVESALVLQRGETLVIARDASDNVVVSKQ